VRAFFSRTFYQHLLFLDDSLSFSRFFSIVFFSSFFFLAAACAAAEREKRKEKGPPPSGPLKPVCD